MKLVRTTTVILIALIGTCVGMLVIGAHSAGSVPVLFAIMLGSTALSAFVASRRWSLLAWALALLLLMALAIVLWFGTAAVR